jgi:transcriptional regulator with XRE-family HTH domain
VNQDQEARVADRRFAANVKTARERLGMSQADLAAALADQGLADLTQQKIAAVESGTRGVKIGEALAFARALRMSVDALARPAGLTREAGDLLDATREVRTAAREAVSWARQLADGTARLQRIIELAQAAGHEDALADELTIARKALEEASAQDAVEH